MSDFESRREEEEQSIRFKKRKSFYEEENLTTEEAESESVNSFSEEGQEDVNSETDQEDLNSEIDENEEALKPLPNELSKEKLAKFQARIEKTGVCYMSRIAPFMKHTKLRSMLQKYGQIGRIYLNPENSKIAARRKKYKKNKRQNFVEGWIEFMDKKIARQCAEHLNNTNMGGKKRSYYYDDIWNIKYLPKFKWNHLTEQLAYEVKVRDQKLAAEAAQAKKESKLYIKNVEKAKMIESIEQRNAGKPESSTKIPRVEVKRRFKQRKVITDDGGKV